MAVVKELSSKKEVSIFDDKKFVIKLSFLLVMIFILSTLGIMQERKLDFLKGLKLSSIELQSLQSIEKKLNGHGIDLSLSKSDFESLSELDLSDIEISPKVQEHKSGQVPKVVEKKSLNTKDKILISEYSDKKNVTAKKSIIITSQIIKPIGSIKKRFFKTNDISLALQISQKFYQEKKYKKALKWSLIANEIDNANEKTWILFAKSKVKLAKKEDAIKALEAYLKDHKSTNVKNLLDDIRRSK